MGSTASTSDAFNVSMAILKLYAHWLVAPTTPLFFGTVFIHRLYLAELNRAVATAPLESMSRAEVTGKKST